VEVGSYPKKILMRDIGAEKGNFAVFCRGKVYQMAKIEEADDTWVTFTMIEGLDKGSQFRAKYDAEQEVNVYDQGSLILAPFQLQDG
jgi:hypothetical protein